MRKDVMMKWIAGLLLVLVVLGLGAVIVWLGVVGGCREIGVDLTFVGILLAAFVFLYGLLFKGVLSAIEASRTDEFVRAQIELRDEEQYPGAEGIAKLTGDLVAGRLWLYRELAISLLPFLVAVFCVVIGYFGGGDWLVKVGLGALLIAFSLVGYWCWKLFYVSPGEVEKEAEKVETRVLGAYRVVEKGKSR